VKAAKRAIILGCGPAGLLAALAAEQLGFLPTILSKKRPSNLYGCQYLHSSIPGTASANQAPEMVDYVLVGDSDQYRTKVYGPEKPRSVSPQLYTGRHPAWDIRSTYRELYQRYEDRIVHYEFSNDSAMKDVREMAEWYEPSLLVSSIPPHVLCHQPDKHEFRSVGCWAIGDAPRKGIEAPKIAQPFTVLCDGTQNSGWYRAANVFGHSTVEWPGWRSKPPIEHVVEFRKPLGTDCDCWKGVVRVGRMGKWEKGVLAHHAYRDTIQAIRTPPEPVTNEANI
jgi:hypothetical protein